MTPKLTAYLTASVVGIILGALGIMPMWVAALPTEILVSIVVISCVVIWLAFRQV
jgi:hypothetical protein